MIEYSVLAASSNALSGAPVLVLSRLVDFARAEIERAEYDKGASAMRCGSV